MKKIFVALVMLTLLLFNLPKPLERVAGGKGAAVVFHLYENAEGAEFKGSTYRVVCGIGEAEKVRSGLTGIAGVEVIFRGGTDTAALLRKLSAVNVLREEFDDVTVYTGYSALLTGGIRLNRGIVNFQIAVSDSAVTIGSPVIIGSY